MCSQGRRSVPVLLTGRRLCGARRRIYASDIVCNYLPKLQGPLSVRTNSYAEEWYGPLNHEPAFCVIIMHLDREPHLLWLQANLVGDGTQKSQHGINTWPVPEPCTSGKIYTPVVKAMQHIDVSLLDVTMSRDFPSLSLLLHAHNKNILSDPTGVRRVHIINTVVD